MLTVPKTRHPTTPLEKRFDVLVSQACDIEGGCDCSELYVDPEIAVDLVAEAREALRRDRRALAWTALHTGLDADTVESVVTTFLENAAW